MTDPGNDRTKHPLIHGELKFVLTMFVTSMVMFSLMRGLFLWVYLDHFGTIPVTDLVPGFWHGARFDAAVSSMVWGPLLLISHLPLLRPRRWFRLGWTVLSYAAFFCLFMLTLSDLQYFEHAGKRLSFEAIAYLKGGVWPIIQTSVTGEPVQALIGCALAIGLITVAVWNIRRQYRAIAAPISPRGYLSVLLTVAVFVVLMRGGLQRIPLRVADTFVSPHHQVTQLVANVPYLIVRTSFTSPSVDIMDSRKAQDLVEQLLALDSAHRPDPALPLLQLHGSKAGEGVRRLNVVIILMESFSAKFTAAAGHPLGATPCFDSLARGGLLLDRFFATGYRTANGFFSTLTGIPDMASGMPVLRRSELRDTFGSLSVLLHA
jgi:phosphoglycerol transferase MdoB-like AlkP superfamily enzyme